MASENQGAISIILPFIHGKIKQDLERKILDSMSHPGKTLKNNSQYESIARELGFNDIVGGIEEIDRENGKIARQRKAEEARIAKQKEQKEARMRDWFVQHLDVLERGLQYRGHEVNIRSGRVDIDAKDASGRPVRIELKAVPDYNDIVAGSEIRRYYNDNPEGNARVIFAAPEIRGGLFFDVKREHDGGNLKILKVAENRNGWQIVGEVGEKDFSVLQTPRWLNGKAKNGSQETSQDEEYVEVVSLPTRRNGRKNGRKKKDETISAPAVSGAQAEASQPQEPAYVSAEVAKSVDPLTESQTIEATRTETTQRSLEFEVIGEKTYDSDEEMRRDLEGVKWLKGGEEITRGSFHEGDNNDTSSRLKQLYKVYTTLFGPNRDYLSHVASLVSLHLGKAISNLDFLDNKISQDLCLRLARFEGLELQYLEALTNDRAERLGRLSAKILDVTHANYGKKQAALVVRGLQSAKNDSNMTIMNEHNFFKFIRDESSKSDFKLEDLLERLSDGPFMDRVIFDGPFAYDNLGIEQDISKLVRIIRKDKRATFEGKRLYDIIAPCLKPDRWRKKALREFFSYKIPRTFAITETGASLLATIYLCHDPVINAGARGYREFGLTFIEGLKQGKMISYSNADFHSFVEDDNQLYSEIVSLFQPILEPEQAVAQLTPAMQPSPLEQKAQQPAVVASVQPTPQAINGNGRHYGVIDISPHQAILTPEKIQRAKYFVDEVLNNEKYPQDIREKLAHAVKRSRWFTKKDLRDSQVYAFFDDLTLYAMQGKSPANGEVEKLIGV